MFEHIFLSYCFHTFYCARASAYQQALTATLTFEAPMETASAKGIPSKEKNEFWIVIALQPSLVTISELPVAPGLIHMSTIVFLRGDVVAGTGSCGTSRRK